MTAFLKGLQCPDRKLCFTAKSNIYRTACICFLYFLLFAAFSFTANAQDVLMGLTASGGPQGGGTAFTLKSCGTNFALQKAFVKMGHSPNGDLVRGTDGNFYGCYFRSIFFCQIHF
jgi:hypothetical protein